VTDSNDPMPAGAAPDERVVAVLLVDDQALIGEAVRRMMLPEVGWRYRYVSDPRQAIAVAKEFHPTVILSDLVMPQMDGLELVRTFRADPDTAKIPLIVLSSKEEAATKAEAFRLGANDYLVKLPDRIELVARLRYHTAGYVGMLQRDAAYRALRDDIDSAAKYVESLLPAPLAEERVRTRWRFVPSASLGGDAFGYHWLDDDHFVVYLLDVSGHGVGAALLGVSVLNVLRARTLPGTDFREPGNVLEGLGGAFTMETHGGKFFTIWYGVYRPSTRELRWAGGGHPPALLFSPASPIPVALDSEGPMPGMLPGLAYGTSAVVVPVGARMLLYSDGLYEIRLGDGTVAAHAEFVADIGAEGTGATSPLDVGVARAERLSMGRGYDDDVSVLEVTCA
jgi:sigma-B regulation protein RsbU (phosphoserine phosphatase)